MVDHVCEALYVIGIQLPVVPSVITTQHDLTTIKLSGARIMADSENSRTVPAITCRNILKTTEWFLTAQIADQSRLARVSREDALGRWRSWLRSFQDVERLNAAQQRIEAELLAMSPLNVRRGDAGLLSPECVIAADDGRVAAYRQAEQATERAADAEDQLALELSKADVTSVTGVAAKLHCVLQRGQPGPDFHEFPWPELRRMLDDLLNIGSGAGNFRDGEEVLRPIDSG